MVQQTVQQMLRIDDLAHLSGLPSRTIRFYNTEGLLPAPILRGRVAYYNQEHLLVLTIIKEFKEQQNLPLDVIKQLLEIRAEHGDVRMNLALKQRLLRPLTSGGQDVKLSKEELMQQADVTTERVDELARQGLLFPLETEGKMQYSGDDVLLLQLYRRLEQIGLPIASPAREQVLFKGDDLAASELAQLETYQRGQGYRQADLFKTLVELEQ